MISKHKFRPKLFGDFLKMIMNLFFKWFFLWKRLQWKKG
jgi:hypothetical protein